MSRAKILSHPLRPLREEGSESTDSAQNWFDVLDYCRLYVHHALAAATAKRRTSAAGIERILSKVVDGR